MAAAAAAAARVPMTTSAEPWTANQTRWQVGRCSAKVINARKPQEGAKQVCSGPHLGLLLAAAQYDVLHGAVRRKGVPQLLRRVGASLRIR